tara:strand:- start:3213 stop:3761 length:549 start_codon:yes stop_codon:yes gene_type:complete
MKIKLKTFFLLTIAILFSFAVAEADHPISKYHKLNFDPSSKNKVGDKLVNEIEHFFREAEIALETENIDVLMDLYSENYQNGVHDRSTVKKTWKKLFKDFDNLVTIHNMTFINVDKAQKTVIIRCTGLLMGKPNEKKGMISLDTWNRSDHMLSKENGKWKIMGNSGKERKRLWFSRPLHPLF